MFEQDYLMRMILQLVEAIRRAMELERRKHDPGNAAEMLEAVIGQATELDGTVLLSLAPESIADILQVSGTDPAVVEFVGRSLLLQSEYLREAGDASLAQLREGQARALAQAYGFSLGDGNAAESEMDDYLDSLTE